MKTWNMMTVSVLAILLAVGLNLPAPAYGETVLIDFGNDSSWGGVTTPSPDVNGNYWTSVWSDAYYPDMVDIDGNPTTIDFGFAPGGAGGTDSYNGPAGVTSQPDPTPANIAATDIDAVALGNLGVNEAAMDFYTSSSFEIQGLNPDKTYNLTFFGSHKYSTDATTVYEIYTDNTYTSMIASANLDISDAPQSASHNRDMVATINDLDPQDDNILYVKFIGIDGGFGYLNCMQIEEALGVKARNPVPRDGATVVPVTTNLKWNRPSEYSPAKSVLRFRPADTSDPNWIVVDPVDDLDLDGDLATIEAAVPMVLDFNTKYDWKVTSFKLNDPNEFEGPIWSFTTEAELRVDAGPSIITWLQDGSVNVDLNGSITYPDTLSSILWSVVDKPVTATVDIDDDTSAVTSASLDVTGDYVLKLWAQDDSVPLEDEDTIEIHVFADACLAAKANPAGYTPLLHDSTDDCRVDLEDFVQFAADWLTDLSLTENLEY